MIIINTSPIKKTVWYKKNKKRSSEWGLLGIIVEEMRLGRKHIMEEMRKASCGTNSATVKGQVDGRDC